MNPVKRKYQRGLLLILALVFALAALAACGAKDAKSAESPSSSAAPAKEAQALALGEAGRTDELEITVTKAEKAAEWINGPPEGHVYIVVSFKITNISKEEQSVAASDFQYVKDGMRESYERTTGVKADPDTFGGEDIAPKDTFEGSLVYAVPADMHEMELHYIEGYSTDPDLKFLLAI